MKTFVHKEATMHATRGMTFKISRLNFMQRESKLG